MKVNRPLLGAFLASALFLKDVWGMVGHDGDPETGLSRPTHISDNNVSNDIDTEDESSWSTLSCQGCFFFVVGVGAALYLVYHFLNQGQGSGVTTVEMPDGTSTAASTLMSEALSTATAALTSAVTNAQKVLTSTRVSADGESRSWLQWLQDRLPVFGS